LLPELQTGPGSSSEKFRFTLWFRTELHHYPGESHVAPCFHVLPAPSLPSFTSPLSTVIVVDALDECGPDGSPERKLLLRTLKDWSRLPASFKLLVTSRDEHDIRQSLQNINQHIGLPTGELVELEASNDISLFFRCQFAEIIPSYPTRGPERRQLNVSQSALRASLYGRRL
jgi:hypothetical protein